MCECTIMRINKGPWKLGEIVNVQEDGAVWGRYDTIEAWVAAGGTAQEYISDTKTFPKALLKLPGVSVDDMKRFLEHPIDVYVKEEKTYLDSLDKKAELRPQIELAQSEYYDVLKTRYIDLLANTDLTRELMQNAVATATLSDVLAQEVEHPKRTVTRLWQQK